MENISVAVYAGPGSSHSWTWLADLFECAGISEARFLDLRGFLTSLSSGADVAVVSGGDGFSIAASFQGSGFRGLGDFISNGGKYIGICAGAYLPLPSSIEPFSEFNLSCTKVENINRKPVIESATPPRIAVSYGSCSLVHPVRGEVELDLRGERFLAPLYGGPIFKEPTEDDVLLRYHGLTENSEVQMSRSCAENMLPGRPAAVRCIHGSGELMLFGPHLEHPRYARANALFLEILGMRPTRIPSAPEDRDHPNLRKTLADLRVAILGLENRSFVVGKKVWDGSRYLELVGAIEKRAHALDEGSASELSESLSRVREDLLRTKIGVESDIDATTQLLVESARVCVDSHFQTLSGSR
jgi:hypothetical protein